MNRIPKTVSDRDSDPFLIRKPAFILCECKALLNQAYEMRKKGVLDRDSLESLILRTCERNVLSERDLCV